MTTKKDYDTILRSFKTDKNEHTHTRIGDKTFQIYGGKYDIDDIDKFHAIYYKKIFVNGQKEYLTERQLTDGKGQILIDLDFRYNTCIEERQHDDTMHEDLIQLYMEEIDKLVKIDTNQQIPIFIFEKPNVNRQPEVTKDGIHIIIGIQMPHEIQLLLREKVIQRIDTILDDLPLQNNYEEVFDRGISKGTTNWQVFGSRKPGNESYELVKYWDVSFDEDRELDIEETDLKKPEKDFYLKLIPIISARNPNALSVPFKKTAIERCNKVKSVKKSKVRSKKIKIIEGTTLHAFEEISSEEELNDIIEKLMIDSEENDKFEIKEAHEYCMCLDNQYYEPYDKWMDVGWTLFCINYSLFPTWIAFSLKSDKFNFDSVPEMFELWNKMERRGKTLGSLMYWARECDPTKYKEIKEDSLNYYINRTLDGETEYDIARVLYKMYSDKYKCVSTKNKIWYECNANGKWREVEEGISLSAKLSTTLNQKYVDREHELINKVCTLQNEEERVKTQQLVAKMANISNKLRKTAWKRNIMTEASTQFYDKHFMHKLDSNPNILCCKNGVIDFDNGGEFRKGKPDDYVSLCTNINYIKFDQLNSEHIKIKDEVETFFKQLFPNPQLNRYMWEHLASILIGKNVNQTFNMYTGCGRNGKSKLVEFMSTLLGDYKGTVPISLVTQKRGQIGGVSPEIANLKGLRYAVMQEPSKGMQLNEGVMKELTGGDPIQGRKLFRDVVTYIPQFTLVVCTNHLFDIKTDDDGTWRRIRVCDFESKFVSKPSTNPDDLEFLVDRKIDENFNRWREIALSMLVEIAIKTGGKVADCDAVFASSNKYKATQDHFTAFFGEKIVQCSGESCSCNTGKQKDKCRMKMRDVLEVFKTWYVEL
jgi:P4 family phage/plasmid primase-like protien